MTPPARPLEMPPLPNLSLKVPGLARSLGLGPRSTRDVVGLDIQPGFAVAVQASVNGSIHAERAACLPLAADTVRAGEVTDQDALSEVLRELFAGRRLGKRVRVGVANQRTVMRTLELPPVSDRKELAAAVRFQAQDQVPMPLTNAVLDFHPLGIVETPSGPRQHVVLVAAQRDMIEHLLAAVRAAGLQPVGVDLSAFALIRSLYRRAAESEEKAGRVVYLNVDGLTNLAIAEGTVCRFTRVVGGGLEGMAVELAERLGTPLIDARAKLLTVDLNQPLPVGALAAGLGETVPGELAPEWQLPEPDDEEPAAAEQPHAGERAEPDDGAPRDEGMEEESGSAEVTAPGPQEDVYTDDPETLERSMSYAELSALDQAAEELPQEPDPHSEADAYRVLENGVREISGEVRNSLDFHRSQEGGGEVSHVVLSGSALDIPGFAEVLQGHLGLEVRTETVELDDGGSDGSVSTHRLAIAAGLASEEVHQ